MFRSVYCFILLFCVLFVCKCVLLPPAVNPLTVNKYIMLSDYDTQFYSYFISLHCKIVGSHNEHKRDGILYIAFLLVFFS